MGAERQQHASTLLIAADEPRSGRGAAPNIANATQRAPYENAVGMRFVPVPITGAAPGDVLFSIFETRVRDFARFIQESGYAINKGEPCSTIESDGKGGWIARPAGGDWKNPRFPPQAQQTGDHPVVCVSWEDAIAFCRWLTQREAAAGRLPGRWAYRLPTDHEWSCAVGLGDQESGSTTPEEKNWKIKGVYPWGKQWPPPPQSGNYAGVESHIGVTAGASWVSIKGYRDAWPRTAAVGRHNANAFDLFDLGGNVGEWCLSKYNPREAWRVLRGGSWHYGEPSYLLSSCRDVAKPADRRAYSGFRVVLSPSGTEPVR